MIEVQRLAGMRSDEVCRMRPADIDTPGTVWVNRPTRFKGQHREGAARREVLLGPQAQAVLGLFLRRPADAYLFSPAVAAVERFARLRAARRIGHACGFTTEIYAEADRRKAMAAAARVG